jgi:hypothetical protein
MKRLLLTFDYELYLDGGNDYELLLRNTERLLSHAKNNAVKFVFFIDILYVLRLESVRLDEAFGRIAKQINEIQNDGHEIQFHYHPHWINSDYDAPNNRWLFHRDEYSFADIVNKYGLEFLIADFELALKKMEAHWGYKPIAYRAGGLSINQNQPELLTLLLDNGFLYDSSVLPGYKVVGDYLNLDHTVKFSKDSWHISPESGFFSQSTATRSLIEVPLMTVDKHSIGLIRRVSQSIKYRTARYFSREQLMNADIISTMDLGTKMVKEPVSITFDKSRFPDLIIMRHYTDEYFLKHNILCVLSHPKSMHDTSFWVMKQYIDWIRSARKNVEFIGFRDLAALRRSADA